MCVCVCARTFWLRGPAAQGGFEGRGARLLAGGSSRRTVATDTGITGPNRRKGAPSVLVRESALQPHSRWKIALCQEPRWQPWPRCSMSHREKGERSAVVSPHLHGPVEERRAGHGLRRHPLPLGPPLQGQGLRRLPRRQRLFVAPGPGSQSPERARESRCASVRVAAFSETRMAIPPSSTAATGRRGRARSVAPALLRTHLRSRRGRRGCTVRASCIAAMACTVASSCDHLRCYGEDLYCRARDTAEEWSSGGQGQV